MYPVLLKTLPHLYSWTHPNFQQTCFNFRSGTGTCTLHLYVSVTHNFCLNNVRTNVKLTARIIRETETKYRNTLTIYYNTPIVTMSITFGEPESTVTNAEGY